MKERKAKNIALNYKAENFAFERKIQDNRELSDRGIIYRDPVVNNLISLLIFMTMR